MPRSAALVAAAVAILAVGLPAGSAAASTRCVPRGAHVEARSASVVVVRTDVGESSTWTACRRSTGRRLVLLEGGTVFERASSRAVDFRVQGRFVAFGRIFLERGGGSATLMRADLGPGGGLAELGPFAPYVPAKLTYLELTHRGAIAFVSDSSYDLPLAATSEAGVVDGSGFRLVARGPLGSITGPTLTTSAFTWVSSGIAGSTRVTPPPA